MNTIYHHSVVVLPMLKTLIEVTHRYPLAVILLSGFLIFVLSGFSTFYWANTQSSHSTSPIVQSQEDEKKEDVNQNRSTDRDRLDTETLQPENWERFMDYKGKRRRMIGIQKSYNVVNFRKGPGTERKIIATPEGGTLLQPLDRFNQWYRARLPNGTIGWIHESLVRQLDVPLPVVRKILKNTPSLESSTKRLIPSEFKNHNRIVISEDVVNVRQGPGTQFPIIDRIYKYEEPRLLASRDNWYRIETFSHNEGWIHQSLGDTIVKVDKSLPNTVLLQSDHLRLGPRFQFREQSIRGDSMTATVIDRYKKWYQVRVDNDRIGWVLKNEVSPGREKKR